MITRVVPGVVFATIRFGDTLQSIAAREMGNAAQWRGLIDLNNLKSPYIVEPGLGGDGLLEYGQSIAIPSSSSTISPTENANTLYAADVRLTDGVIDVTDGDFSLSEGIANLSQSLRHRITVEKRDLWFHPEYGCWIRSLLGKKNDAASANVAAMYVKSSLLEDPRVKRVEFCTAEVLGDSIKVNASVIPISGESFKVYLVV